MKNFYFMISLIAGLSFISCDNEDKIVYSCDPTEDEWVHDKLDEIRSMTRTQWNALNENLKIPVYRAFTQQQQINLWIEKFKDALTLDWSELEKEHINAIIEFINEHPDLFGEGKLTDEQQDYTSIFFYKWRETAMNQLGWDKKIIRSLIYSANTLLDTKGTLAVSNNVATIATRSEADPPKWKCNCKKTIL